MIVTGTTVLKMYGKTSKKRQKKRSIRETTSLGAEAHVVLEEGGVRIEKQ